jgi:hypothetical protein
VGYTHGYSRCSPPANQRARATGRPGGRIRERGEAMRAEVRSAKSKVRIAAKRSVAVLCLGWMYMLVACMTLTGCIGPIPKKWPTSPEIQGRVVDSVTARPVVGARVAIVDRPKTAVLTDADGAFSVAAVREFAFAVATACPVFYYPKIHDRSSELEISCSGYEPLRIEAWNHLAKPFEHWTGPWFLTDLPLVRKPE